MKNEYMSWMMVVNDQNELLLNILSLLIMTYVANNWLFKYFDDMREVYACSKRWVKREVPLLLPNLSVCILL